MKQRPRIYYSESQKALMWERWRKGETLHQIDEPGVQGGLRGMTAVLDDPAAGDHDVANGGAASRENEMIEGTIRDGAGHARMRAVEDQPIRTSTHLDGSGRRQGGDGPAVTVLHWVT